MQVCIIDFKRANRRRIMTAGSVRLVAAHGFATVVTGPASLIVARAAHMAPPKVPPMLTISNSSRTRASHSALSAPAVNAVWLPPPLQTIAIWGFARSLVPRTNRKSGEHDHTGQGNIAFTMDTMTGSG